jgi:hypothetical protein
LYQGNTGSYNEFGSIPSLFYGIVWGTLVLVLIFKGLVKFSLDLPFPGLFFVEEY